MPTPDEHALAHGSGSALAAIDQIHRELVAEYGERSRQAKLGLAILQLAGQLQIREIGSAMDADRVQQVRALVEAAEALRTDPQARQLARIGVALGGLALVLAMIALGVVLLR